MMFLASSTLTLLALMAFGTAAVVAYLFIPRRPPSAGRKPQQAAGLADASGPAAPDPGQPAAPPPPPARLTLSAVVERMANVGDEETTFLDPTGNRLVTLSDALLAVLEDDDEIEEAIDFSKEELEDLQNKLKSKTLLQLPTKAETNEFKLQERFCEELPEGEAKDQMLKVMLGQTGFRSFDGAVKRLGIEGDWQRLRYAELARIAFAWVEKNGIACDCDMPVPGDSDQELRQAS
ncbi:MAG: hypothetical protein ACYTGF_15330 [Planctomycetota bacterium]|jgi:hypothetical protein